MKLKAKKKVTDVNPVEIASKVVGVVFGALFARELGIYVVTKIDTTLSPVNAGLIQLAVGTGVMVLGEIYGESIIESVGLGIVSNGGVTVAVNAAPNYLSGPRNGKMQYTYKKLNGNFPTVAGNFPTVAGNFPTVNGPGAGYGQRKFNPNTITLLNGVKQMKFAPKHSMVG